MKRLPRELKALRREMRLIYGRGKYDQAHEYAERLYRFRLAERCTDRWRGSGTGGPK